MTPQAQLKIDDRGAVHVPEYATLQGKIEHVIFHNPQSRPRCCR